MTKDGNTIIKPYYQVLWVRWRRGRLNFQSSFARKLKITVYNRDNQATTSWKYWGKGCMPHDVGWHG